MKNIYFLIRPSYQRIAFLVLCILMVTVPGVISAQSGKQQIKGQVLDGQGDALIGVAVRNLMTSTGVITDIDGFYAIEAQKGEILEFSYVGYNTVKKEVANSSSISIVMTEDVQSLDEVVVVGMGTQRKASVIGSIASVRMADLKVPSRSLENALVGRMAGIIGVQRSGEPGQDASSFWIRGISTFGANQDPLVLVDGVERSFFQMDPNEIESINVLKDASATALYGTRAANGVIVVTTKKGRIGKPVLSYTHSSKITRRPRYTDRNINLMNSQERVRFGKELADQHYIFPTQMPMVGYEGALYRLQSGLTDYDTFLNEVTWYEQVNTDWFDILTRDAYSHSHTLNVSGGSDIVRYYASLGYDRDNGVSNTTYTERYTVTAKMDVQMTSKMLMAIKLNGNVQKKNHLVSTLDAMDYAYNTTRALPCFNEDGSLFYYERYRGGYGGQGNKYLRYNIVNEIDNSSSGYDGKGIQVDLNLKYNILPTWDVTATGSYSVSSTLQEDWWGDKTAYVAALKNGEYEDKPIPGDDGKCILPYGGILKTKNSDTENLTFRLQSNYRKLFGEDDQHLITALLGYEVNMLRSKSMNNEVRGYLKERGMQFADMSSLNLDDYPLYKEWLQQNHLTLTRGLTNQLSLYLSLTYGYREYFTLNVNGRTDASNKFGSRSNEKFLPIWSVSGMWNLKETFMKHADFISNMRLRTSYGIQGNMLEDQSPNLILRQGTPNMLITQQPINSYYNENVSNVYQFPNPNLKWEETKQTNIGLDMSFFNGRLNIGGDFYYKKTENVFSWVNVAPTNGLTSYLMNNGSLKNVGYSVTLSATPVKINDFAWRISTSYSANKNKTQTDAVEKYELEDYLAGTAIISGESVGTFYSYEFLGLNAQNGTPVFDDYTDRRHLLEDKSLEDVVRMVMTKSGTREPVFSGNLFNTFTWRGITLSFNLAYSLGSKVRLFALYEPIISGVSAENNVRKEFVNRWQVPGDEKRTRIPAIINRSDEMYDYYNRHWSQEQSNKTKTFAYNLWDMYDNSDIRVVSGNYLKMQTLTLRYSLQPKLLKKTPFSSASVSFSTQNLFTISAKALKGQDPSQAGFAKPNLSVRPNYTIGLNVSF